MPIADAYLKELNALITRHDRWHGRSAEDDPPVEGAEARIRTGWRAHEKAFRAGLRDATPRGRELWELAAAYVAAAMPVEQRDLYEQAAFYAACTQTSGDEHPVEADFGRRWIQAGGVEYATEVGLLARKVICVNVDAWDALALIETDESAALHGQDYGHKVLLWLRVPLAAASEAERARLRGLFEPRVEAMTPLALAALAFGYSHAGWARRAAERILADTSDDGWELPLYLLDVLDDGELVRKLALREGSGFQYHGASCLARAALRLPAAPIARLLVDIFEASLMPRSPWKVSSVKPFLKLACCIDDPALARFFATHAVDKKFADASARYATRFGQATVDRTGVRSTRRVRNT